MATELSNLPTDPSVPGQGGPPQIPENIKMETTAYRNDMDVKPVVPPMADTKQMNSMVSEIQNAAKQGLTRLAEDIPRQENQVTQDPQTLPNSIPEENSTPIDYIQNHATPQEIEDQLTRKQNKKNTIDVFLDELKLPLALSVVYFLFQTKLMKKSLLLFAPFLFNDVGSYSTNGQMLVSFAFGALIFVSLKIATHLGVY